MKFVKSNFNFHGGYLIYDKEFVARFKHNRKRKAGFVKFLVENFTQDEYFARLKSGESPIQILESKGYSSMTKAEMLKQWYQLSEAHVQGQLDSESLEAYRNIFKKRGLEI